MILLISHSWNDIIRNGQVSGCQGKREVGVAIQRHKKSSGNIFCTWLGRHQYPGCSTALQFGTGFLSQETGSRVKGDLLVNNEILIKKIARANWMPQKWGDPRDPWNQHQMSQWPSGIVMVRAVLAQNLPSSRPGCLTQTVIYLLKAPIGYLGLTMSNWWDELTIKLGKKQEKIKMLYGPHCSR